MLHRSAQMRVYGAGLLDTDTDGDCRDAREISSINGDRNLNSIDLARVFSPFNDSGYIPHFDINKDAPISSIDLGQMALRCGPCS